MNQRRMALRRSWARAAVAGAVLAAACSERTAPLAPDAGPLASRGVGGPADTAWVVTPAGYMPAQCVHEVPDRAHVDRTGVVTRPDGSKFQLPWCGQWKAAAKRDATGGPRATPSPDPVNNGWIEYASWLPGYNLKRLQAIFYVPATPAGAYTSTDQVYYTFPGIQSSAYIIQPVLQYTSSGWKIASWHCNDGSNCTHSTFLSVSSGGSLWGSVNATNCSGGNCTWTIVTKNEANQQSTTLTVTDTENYYWAFGGAVEVYGLTSCSQYPASGAAYNNIYVENASGTQVTPTWSPVVGSGLSPSCSFGVSGTATNQNFCHNSGIVMNPVSSSPAPAVQYLPFSINVSGCGFDPSTVQMQLIGTTPNSSCPTACTVSSFSTKTATQLVGSISLSLPGTYSVYVRNGSTGGWYGGSGTSITVRSMY